LKGIVAPKTVIEVSAVDFEAEDKSTGTGKWVVVQFEKKEGINRMDRMNRIKKKL
jgi:hypothetical protein